MSIDYLSEAEAVHLVEVGGFAIRDVGLLFSVIARPQATVYGMEAYPDLWAKAAALLESLARHHALVDGNKRIALVLTDVFLGLNGWDLQDSPEHVAYILAVCTGQMPLEQSAEHLQRHCVRDPRTETDVT